MTRDRGVEVRIRHLLAGVGILLCLSVIPLRVEAADEPVTVTTSVDKQEIAIGERVRYEVSVEYPEGMVVTLPSFGEQLGEFAIEDFGREQRRLRGGRVRETQWYLLDGYTAGEYRIPPAVAVYQEAGVERLAEGPEQSVTVKSLLPSDWESMDIAGAESMVVPRRMRGWWVALAFALAAVVAGGVWWRRRLRRDIGEPPRPAHDTAFEELAALRRAGLIDQHMYEEYYIRLSGVVRRYVERRFYVRAPEMTTEEFLQAATTASELNFDQRQLLRQFLVHCDMVKFARYRPSEREAEEAFAAAHRFVQETKAVPVDEDETDSAGSGGSSGAAAGMALNGASGGGSSARADTTAGTTAAAPAAAPAGSSTQEAG